MAAAGFGVRNPADYAVTRGRLRRLPRWGGILQGMFRILPRQVAAALLMGALGGGIAHGAPGHLPDGASSRASPAIGHELAPPPDATSMAGKPSQVATPGPSPSQPHGLGGANAVRPVSPGH